MDKFKFEINYYRPSIEELTNYEKDMLGMIDNIQFPKVNSNFKKLVTTEVKNYKKFSSKR